MSGFTDIHSHFIYGVDDGAADGDEMREMLMGAVSQGVSELYATSHVEPGIRPFDHERYAKHLDEAREFCRAAGLQITLHSGGEVLFSPGAERYALDRSLPTLGDSDRMLLEFFPDASGREIESAVDAVLNSGYTPVLAHIERYRAMFDDTPYYLKDRYNVLYQVNCRPAIRGDGMRQRSVLKKWFRAGLIDFIGSDMHDPVSRPCLMREAYEEIKKKYGADEAYRMTNGAGLRD